VSRGTGESQLPVGRPFRAAVFRGLAVLFPPLLTILIFVWAINTIRQYLLEPVTALASEALVWAVSDVREDLAWDPLRHTATVGEKTYYRLEDGTFVPLAVYDRDLNLTIDEAIQFIISCGLVLPAGELKRLQVAPSDGQTDV
jgi:hypothetical protein